MSTAREPTIATRILATIADFRRKGTMASSLCWDAGELERLAMFAIATKNDVARGVSSLRAPQSGPPLPDTFIERAIRTALAQPEYKLEGDTVVGLSGAEASFIRQKYAERNRGSGAETPPQPETEK